MWSDREIDDFSTFGRAEKVSVFKGFRLFSKILRRAWWLSPERSALPSWATPRLWNCVLWGNSSSGICSRRYALFLLPLPPRASQRIARALRRLPLLSAPLIRPRRRSRTSPSWATPRLHTSILYHLPPLLSSLFYKDFFSPRVFSRRCDWHNHAILVPFFAFLKAFWPLFSLVFLFLLEKYAQSIDKSLEI